MEQEQPSREDWYLMQIAAEVHRSSVKNPERVKIEDKRLKLVRDELPKKMTRREAAKAARERWLPMFGIKPKD